MMEIPCGIPGHGCPQYFRVDKSTGCWLNCPKMKIADIRERLGTCQQRDIDTAVLLGIIDSYAEQNAMYKDFVLAIDAAINSNELSGIGKEVTIKELVLRARNHRDMLEHWKFMKKAK